jgi:transposase
VEPADHAIGRSRGGLSTKIHQLCDGAGLPLVMLIGPGQGGDSPMLTHLLAALKIHRRAGTGPGRPRTTPDALLGDKTYSSRGTRALLRSRGIRAVIPEPSDQIGHRKRRGRAGGRPPALDAVADKRRNVVERGFNTFKQWRALATRYDKLALTYRAGVVLRAVVLWLTALGDTPLGP